MSATMTWTGSTISAAENLCVFMERTSTTHRFSYGSSIDRFAPGRRGQKKGEGISPSPVYYAALSPEPTSLKHDAEGNRNELHRAGIGRIAVVTRFDERLEDRQRQVDTSAGVPAEVIVGLARGTSYVDGCHVQAAATDQIRRNADVRQTPHGVSRCAHDVKLGSNASLLAERIVRTIDAQTNRDERQADSQSGGRVVTEACAVLEVAHWLSGAASDANLERLDETELRLRDARGRDECDRGDR